MASKVLLISANRCTHPDPVFPLGLAHLNAALREAGHTTRWADCLAGAEPIDKALTEFQPDFVGISVRNIDDVLIGQRETYFESVPALIATIRQKTGCPVILGGSGFSIFPGPLLALAGADYGICGEGEGALTALIKALETGGDLAAIPRLVYRQQGNITANAPAPYAAGNAALTDEDWPEAIMAPYRASGIMNVQTQRGCHFRCAYCTYPVIEGRQHRRRPAEIVAAEFEQLQRRGARYVFIVDSVFNSSPDHVANICEALLRRQLKLPWGCFLRPQGLTAELMRLMSRAGLTHIEFGSDSFCDEVLAAYQKDFTFADILRASELANQEKIDFCHYLIAGGPGETDATLAAGYAQSLRLRGSVILAVVGMRIYPGTHLFERAVAEGRIPRETNLLTPTYYLAPGLTADRIFERLKEFAHCSPNWIVGHPAAAYSRLVERLRLRGVVGPLWGYFAMIQRLWPQGVPGTAPL
jgi:radical SAM superfamily enzyme YgiQ (UPF0313 family)